MILTHSQREAIKHLAHNLTPTTLAAIVAELSDSEDWSLKATATICGIVGIGNCGEEEFTEMVMIAANSGQVAGPVGR